MTLAIAAAIHAPDDPEAERLYMKPPHRNWTEVSGKMDTGAATTVISAPLHGHLLVKRWPRRTPLHVKLAKHDVKIRVKEEGLMHLKINETDFRLVKCILNDSDEWRNVLIGRDFLKYHGLMVTDVSNAVNITPAPNDL